MQTTQSLPFVHVGRSGPYKGNEGNLSGPAVRRGRISKTTRGHEGLSSGSRRLVGYFGDGVGVYILHWTFMTLFAALFMNVQVATRYVSRGLVGFLVWFQVCALVMMLCRRCRCIFWRLLSLKWPCVLSG